MHPSLESGSELYVCVCCTHVHDTQILGRIVPSIFGVVLKTC